MIGIDVVDLNDPLLRRREASFRFITHTEDVFDPGIHSFWHLWAAKEAVFKARRSREPFSPRRFPVRFVKEKEGLVFSSGPYSGNLFSDTRYLLATCSINDPDRLVYHVVKDGSHDPSTYIRTYIHRYFQFHFGENISVITDHAGLPVLSHSLNPLSISHHGQFAAFAFSSEDLFAHPRRGFK